MSLGEGLRLLKISEGRALDKIKTTKATSVEETNTIDWMTSNGDQASQSEDKDISPLRARTAYQFFMKGMSFVYVL